MPRSHRRLLRSVDTRSTAPLRGVGCCGRWRQGPLRRSGAWAVVAGGHKVYWAARRLGLLWSVETGSTGARSEAWSVVVGGRKVHWAAQRRGAVAVGGDKVHCAARRRGLLWRVETRPTGPAQRTGLLVCGDRVRRVQFWLRLVSIWARNGWRRDRTEN